MTRWGPVPEWVDGALRILVDCRYTRLTLHDGVGRFTSRLVAELGRRHPVVMLVSDRRQLAMLPDLPWALGPSPSSPLDAWVAPRAINRLEPDVVFTPLQTMGPYLRRYRLVTTIHDLIYFRHRTPPRHLPPVLRLGWRVYHATPAIQRHVLALADAHVTVSETTRRRLVELGMDARPITVVPNGVDHPASPPARRAPANRDILYVGSFMPYKNVATLARAMHRLPGWRLRLVSEVRPRERRALEALAPAGSLEFLDGASDADYAALLADARILASASLDEGFGVPLIDALAAGTPIAVSDIEVFHEVAGEHAAFFDPRSPEDAARAIAALGDDALWERRSRDGEAWSRRYDWGRSAELLLDALRAVG